MRYSFPPEVGYVVMPVVAVLTILAIAAFVTVAARAWIRMLRQIMEGLRAKPGVERSEAMYRMFQQSTQMFVDPALRLDRRLLVLSLVLFAAAFALATGAALLFGTPR